MTQLDINDIIVILRSIVSNGKPLKIEINYPGGGECFCLFKIREQLNKSDVSDMKKDI